MCPDIFELPNPYGNPKPPSKRFEKALDDIHQYNFHAELGNEQKDIERNKLRQSNAPIFLLCKLCESRLQKKKPIEKDIGFGNIIQVPSYSCKTCHTKYWGFLPHVKHIDNPEIEAEVIEYSGLLQ